VVIAIIMGGAVVSSCAHIEAGMVPISVSLTDPNPDASDPNIDVFRDDNWFVADVQRTSKRRHCQERNKKKSKHSILHDILLEFGTLAVPILRRMRAWYSRSLYRMDQLLHRSLPAGILIDDSTVQNRRQRSNQMAEPKSAANEKEISRDRLAELLNEDLSREYQAIIAYVVYSQVLSGAQYMDIAAQLEIHAKQELDHALILSRQIDYLGKMPAVTPKPVRTSKNPKDMLQYDLDNENETIRNYRDRIRQCEALGEYAMAEQIRQILMQEQDHQIDLATALGIPVPDVSGGPKGRALRKPR
jgi:bacterioferritin